jgi:amino acid transporter
VTGGGYVNFVMAMAASNVATALIITLTPLFSVLGILFCFYFTTRIMFAWSFDRVFPSWISDINERFHSPVKATIVFIILNLIGGIIYAVRPDLLLPLFAAAGSGSAIFAWVPISVTAILFPYIKRDIYAKAPLRNLNIAGIPLVSLFGVVGLVYCLYIAYSFWLATVFEGRATIILVSATALIIFYFAKWYRKRQGLDMSLIFKELPPE